MSDPDEVKDLAAPTATALIAALGAALGVFVTPAAAIPAALGVGAVTLAETIRRRRETKRVRRLETIVTDVQQRLRDHDAEREYTEDEQDLFLTVVRNALDDDEDVKHSMYAAVLEWIVRDSPPSAQVRILADAVRNLSYVELYCFVAECTGKGDKHAYEHYVEQAVVWNRLNGAGLSTGTVRVKGSPTLVGKAFVRYTEADELIVPPVIRLPG